MSCSQRFPRVASGKKLNSLSCWRWWVSCHSGHGKHLSSWAPRCSEQVDRWLFSEGPTEMGVMEQMRCLGRRRGGPLNKPQLRPWDSPGRDTGAGCHFLLQGISRLRDGSHVSCAGRWLLHHCVTWEPLL